MAGSKPSPLTTFIIVIGLVLLIIGIVLAAIYTAEASVAEDEWDDCWRGNLASGNFTLLDPHFGCDDEYDKYTDARNRQYLSIGLTIFGVVLFCLGLYMYGKARMDEEKKKMPQQAPPVEGYPPQAAPPAYPPAYGYQPPTHCTYCGTPLEWGYCRRCGIRYY
jgi:uncharacterized membrane protein